MQQSASTQPRTRLPKFLKIRGTWVLNDIVMGHDSCILEDTFGVSSSSMIALFIMRDHPLHKFRGTEAKGSNAEATSDKHSRFSRGQRRARTSRGANLDHQRRLGARRSCDPRVLLAASPPRFVELFFSLTSSSIVQLHFFQLKKSSLR